MASLRRRDARGAPNAEPGPPWVIEADVTTIYGKRRTTVRFRGGRRVTLVSRSGENDDETLTMLLDNIAGTTPGYPMRTIDEGTDG